MNARIAVTASTMLALMCTGVATAQPKTLRVPADHADIAAAVEAAGAGDTVLVSAGTYRQRVKLKAGVILRSAGTDEPGKLGLARAEATVIDGGGKAEGGPGVTLAEGAVLDGFTVTGIGAFDKADYDKHWATHGEDLPDERGAAGAAAEPPAVAVPGVTATVRNCIVRDNGSTGVACLGTGGRNASLVEGNVACRNMGGGIGLADGAESIVRGNRCFNNLRGGIGNRKSAGLIVGNECYENVRAGIGVREGATPVVRSNKCHDNRRAGIGVRMKGTAPLIEDNECWGNAMAGIGCRDGAEPAIRGNRCHDNTLAGIGARDGASPVIFGNKCWANKEAGIGAQLGAKPYIAHNECYENAKAGIGLRDDVEAVLGGNHVHHNKLAGIGFDECKAGKATLQNNKVLDNELVAVGIHAGWKVRAFGNEFSRVGGMPPLVMVFAGAEADFSDNNFRGGGVAAIRTQGKVRAVGNRMECTAPRKAGPPSFAVWALPGSHVTMLGCTVSGWRHALVADGAAVSAVDNRISGFHGSPLRIDKPVGTAVVVGNVFAGTGEAVVPKGSLVEGNKAEAPGK